MTEISLRFSERRVIHGISVYNTSDRIPAETSYFAVAASLALVEQYDRRRIAMLRRHLLRIIVATQSRNVYWRFARACVLSDKSLATQPAIWTASVIVHEVTHARFYSRGIEPTDGDVRARIEGRCVREQIGFLSRVPGSQTYVEHLRRQVAEGTWFSAQERRAATVDRLRALDAPSWLVRWMDRR